MVVHLPGGGEVVIDSKVPLDAFLHFTEAQNEEDRKSFLIKHGRQLRTHVEQLAKKEYWKQYDGSPEFVIAFIPGEPLLAAACEADATLQDYALNKRVVLATPNTLVAALRTIALSWRQDTLAANAREVKELGAELYERLRIWTGHMQSLQKSLASSVEAYNQAVGSLESRVLVTARKLPGPRRPRRRLGADPGAGADRVVAPAPPSGRADRRRGRDGRVDHLVAARGRRQHRHGAPEPLEARTLGRYPAGRGATPATYSARVLHVHRSDRADALVSMLADLVAVPLDDPMTPEVVSVPTRGIERWLTQRLSSTLGGQPGRPRRGVRQHRFPVSGDPGVERAGPGLGHRPQGRPLVARAGGLAAHRGGRGAFRRSLAGTARPAHQELRDGGGVEALLEHPPRGRSLRPLRRAPAGHVAGLGGGRWRWRRRRAACEASGP